MSLSEGRLAAWPLANAVAFTSGASTVKTTATTQEMNCVEYSARAQAKGYVSKQTIKVVYTTASCSQLHPRNYRILTVGA
eukprot:8826992-Karenia_brevis.AAC.1